jgi:hypothetical protein
MRIGLRHKILVSYRTLIVLTALPAFAADLAFEIPPVPVSVNIAGQPVGVTISGDLSGSQDSITLKLRADLADLQSHITPLLQTELNQSNRCGERISVEKATLAPAAPGASLTIQVHFEKWICIKALGKENARRLVGGEGTVNVILTPALDDGNAIRLDAEIGAIDADGPLGELLHSGTMGDAIRGKIREALLKAIQKSTVLEAAVPAQARPFVTIQSVAFAERGSGILALNLTGRVLVPSEQISSVLEQFQHHK